MKEVKTPRKPLAIYYALVLLMLLLLNFVLLPWMEERQIKEVDYGMSDEFDMVALETVNNQYLGGDTSLACSAQTQCEIDQKVVELVKAQHAKAVQILTDNRAKLDELAQYLYQKETITGDEFMEILNREG